VNASLLRLATLALLTGVGGCTRANPAFYVPAQEPSPDREKDGGRDAPPAEDAAVQAEVSPPDAGADLAAEVPPIDAPEAGGQPGDAGDGGDGGDGAPEDAAVDSSLSLGLVVRYPLDLVASSAVPDDSQARPGAMYGGASWTNVGFPGAQFANGGALVLDGNSGYVTLPVAGLPAVASGKSVSLWFWQAAPINNLRKTLLAYSNPDESSGLNIGLQGGVPSVWFWRQLIGTAIVAGPRSSPAGWTHLVFVQQGNAQRLYLNGTLADSATVSLRSAPVTSFMLGGYTATGGEDERWDGRIDDVRIYSRPLTSAEISALAAGSL
jgi:hypothetical protein